MPPLSLKPTLRGFSAHKPPFQPVWFAPSEQTTGSSRHPAQTLPALPASLSSLYALLAFGHMHFLLLLITPTSSFLSTIYVTWGLRPPF